MFIEGSGSIRNDLEIHLGKRNEGPMVVVVVVVDKSSNSPLFKGNG